MPALFYSPSTGGDVLYVAYPSPAPVESVAEHGDVVALYASGQIVGINVFHASKHFVLSGNGLIPLPDAALLETLNLLLQDAGLAPLSLVTSGYRVYEVKKVEEHPLDEKKSIVTLSDGSKEAVTSTRYRLEAGDRVVALESGHARGNGTFFEASVIRNIPQDVEICSEADLGLGEESKAAYRPTKEIGADFFA